jgi:hypothetical protein
MYANHILNTVHSHGQLENQGMYFIKGSKTILNIKLNKWNRLK